MLITSKINDNYLSVQFNYCNEYIQRIKNVPYASFDGETKRWIFPISSFLYFEREFDGEILFNTPRWLITGEEPPDYTKMYSIDSSINVPLLKVTPYDYQKFGIKFMVDRLEQHGFVINADGVGLGSSLQFVL